MEIRSPLLLPNKNISYASEACDRSIAGFLSIIESINIILTGLTKYFENSIIKMTGIPNTTYQIPRTAIHRFPKTMGLPLKKAIKMRWGMVKIRVSAIQMNMEFENPDKNYKRAEELIRLAAKEKPDTIVLPETWNTGFFPLENIKELCDKNGERTKKLFSALSKELGVNIVGGSVVNEKGGEIYNTSYVFNREGECIAEYDKTHLFSPMHEDDHFKKGGKVTTFELDGVKCGIVICYDIRFLELIRTQTLQGIKVLFVVAQWPVPRIGHWEVLNQARAIENQIFNVCVNSCGTAGQTVYGGHSALINPWGEIIAKASDKEEIITGELDLAIVDKIRSTINVYNDRRPELYKIF